MILTASLSALTSSFAVSRVFLNEPHQPLISLVGGLTWGAFVFCIDRMMILGITSDQAAWRKLVALMFRLPLAIVVALVMSTPVLLRICDSPIKEEARAEQQQMLEKDIALNRKNVGMDHSEKRSSDITRERDEVLNNQRKSPTSSDFIIASRDLETATERYNATTSNNNGLIGRYRLQLKALAETVNGNDNQDRQSRVGFLQKRINQLTFEIKQRKSALDVAKSAQEDARTNWIRDQDRRLQELNRQVDSARADELGSQALLKSDAVESRRRVDEITQLNLVNQIRLLRRITSQPRHRDAMTINLIAGALHTFFLLLELTPVLWKVTTTSSPLDKAVMEMEQLDRMRVEAHHRQQSALTQSDELLEYERSFLADKIAVERIQKQADAALALQRKILQSWQDGMESTFLSEAVTVDNLQTFLARIDGAMTAQPPRPEPQRYFTKSA